MWDKRRATWLMVLAVAGGSGCGATGSQDQPSPPSAPEQAPQPGDLEALPGLDTLPPLQWPGQGPIDVSGTLRGIVTELPPPPMRVCVETGADVPCGLSDADGDFTLRGLEEQAPLVIRFNAPGYFDSMAMYTTHASSNGFLYHVFTEAEMKLLATGGGMDLDRTRGHITFGVSTGEHTLSGAVVSTTAGDQVFYAGPDGVDRSLTATGPTGHGGIPNVVPGEYVIRFDVQDRSCAPDLAWAGTEPNTAVVRVVARRATYVSVVCN